MQGRKRKPQAGMFLYQSPYEKLPRDAFYSALEKQLGDLEWVRAATVELYADGMGRPSLDPVVFLKATLAGFFQHCVTDSELAFRMADSLTFRRFLGYGLDEDTPDRTTLLKTRQRWPVAVFEEIFARVLGQLAEVGLVKGEHLSTDTVLIDANASMDSLRHREFGCDYATYVKALYSQRGETPAPNEIAKQDAARPRKGSNAEWVSETDPEAAVAVHPDGHTAVSYRVDGMMDTETGVIVQIGVAPGNVRDSEDLPQRVAEAQQNLEALGLHPETLTADRGHHSEENLVAVAELGITPIMRERGQPGVAGYRPRDFVYIPELDGYRCAAGQVLERVGEGPAGTAGRYRIPGKVCPHCLYFGTCTKSAQGRVLKRAEHEVELEANRARVRSEEGRGLLSQHRQRAEGPWSYVKLYGGLAWFATRGLTNAWKQVLVQGIGWNLMQLVAHLTGLAPRGRSARRGVLAPGGDGLTTASYASAAGGAASVARTRALVTLLAALAAVITYLLRPRLTGPKRAGPVHAFTYQRGTGPKWALSQGC